MILALACSSLVSYLVFPSIFLVLGSVRSEGCLAYLPRRVDSKGVSVSGGGVFLPHGGIKGICLLHPFFCFLGFVVQVGCSMCSMFPKQACVLWV